MTLDANDWSYVVTRGRKTGQAVKPIMIAHAPSVTGGACHACRYLTGEVPTRADTRLLTALVSRRCGSRLITGQTSTIARGINEFPWPIWRVISANVVPLMQRFIHCLWSAWVGAADKPWSSSLILWDKHYTRSTVGNISNGSDAFSSVKAKRIATKSINRTVLISSRQNDPPLT